MQLDVFKMEPNPPPLVPGRGDRLWMDQTTNRFAYRCLPLTIANQSGWEILCPFSFTVKWNGEQLAGDLRIKAHSFDDPIERFVTSHFAHGVLTFHTGYMFRTSPGWALWAMGPPNSPKDGIAALAGVIETDWLPFPFTMNWKMTRPGSVTFEKGEPFCFITPCPHQMIDEIQPHLRMMGDDPVLQQQYDAYNQSRSGFNNSLKDPTALTEENPWQRFYVRGESPGGAQAGPTHVTKRKLKAPKPAE